MRLIRYGEPGREKPGLLLADGRRVDVSSALGGDEDYEPDFFAGDGLARLGRLDTARLPTVAAGERWGAPVRRPGNIVCVGLNYRRHAAETGIKLPEQPVIFFKATSALCGPYDDVLLPPEAVQADWEVELALVIGRPCRRLTAGEVPSVIAGYTILNDVSERDWQFQRNGGQWGKGKSAETFAPCGPALVTPDEIPDSQRLPLRLRLDGVVKQDSSTEDMIFGVTEILVHVSRYLTLMPGDILSTGTPHGVGYGRKPPEFLRAGQVMELEIEGLGQQRQRVRKA